MTQVSKRFGETGVFGVRDVIQTFLMLASDPFPSIRQEAKPTHMARNESMSDSFQISFPDLPVPFPRTSLNGESQMIFAAFAALTELLGMLLSRLLLGSEGLGVLDWLALDAGRASVDRALGPLSTFLERVVVGLTT